MNPDRLLLRLALFLLVPLATLPAWAEPPMPVELGSAPAPSRVVEADEEEQLWQRSEWFMASRREGLTKPGEMAALRQRAVRQVSDALAAQRLRRLAGNESLQNFWVTMGPAASHFGGWAFGDVSGRITDIARDSAGNVYLASAAGGVWKTTNDGLSWTNLFENAGTQPTGAVAVDPTDDNVVWVGTGDFVTGCEGYFGIGLLRSADGGATWTARNGSGAATLDDLSNFSSIVIDPRNPLHLVVGGTARGCTSGVQQNGGLYVTTDGGATWTRKIADTPIHEIAQDPSNRDVFWASTSQGVFKSSDNAVTWVKQTASGLPSSNTGRTELAVAPSNGNIVYVLYENGDFWRTTNGGGSWTKMSTGACDGQCWYNMTIAVHQTNANTVYRGTILVFKSTDGGSTWTTLTNGWGGSQQVHQDTHALLVDPSAPNKFYVGSDGGLWKSSDGGATFVNMNAGLDLFLFYAIDAQENNGGVICGGAQDNSSLVRTTSNLWDLQAVTGDGFVCAINPQDPNYSYITSYPSGGFPSVSRSTNGVLGSYGGITGSGSGIIQNDRINWVTPYTLDPNNGQVMLLGTHRVYRSTNFGTSWVQTGPLDMTNGSGNLNVVEFNRTDSRVAYAGTGDGHVWRSADNGVNWTDISATLPPGYSINDVGGDPEDVERAFVAVGGFNHAHVYEWTVSRNTWVPVGAGLPNVPANTVLAKTGSEIYVGTDVGVFKSVDGGNNFTPFMDGLPQGLVVTDLKFSRTTNLLTAGTYGRGAYQVSVDPPGPIVLFDSIVQPLVPVDGDGDGSVEPGETWQVTPKLRNAGGLAATGVTARLVTSTPGVTIIGGDVRSYGDIAPGASATSVAPYTFVVDPAFACGGTITFDLVDITSTGATPHFKDQKNAFTVTVVNNYEAPTPVTLLDENFDTNPTTGWTHEAVQVTFQACYGVTDKDEWRFATHDTNHNSSYHCGQGPGKSYSNYDSSWLHYGGKDSAHGPGLYIPPDSVSAKLTIVHWYKTQLNADGGQVVIDAVADGQDTYTPLVPLAGYPGTLATGYCNAQEGRAAFTGTSGGWVTSTFDLSPYVGRTVYLAFVFASDKRTSTDEGWYVDQVKVVVQKRGAPVCQDTPWPGVVDAAEFARVGSSVQATWADACNASSTPGQLYSVQAGNLDTLVATGTYAHAPIGSACTLTSPFTFEPSAGNEYYLVVPELSGREGSFGTDSSGAARPQVSAACGIVRAAACP